jgi:acyl carrier protein
MEVEERFGVDIPINLLPDLVTAGDLEDLVRRQIAARGGAA